MSSRRKWFPAIAGLAFLVAAAAWLARDRRVPHEAFRPYSVHNAGSEGLSLAHRYLRGSRPVSLLTRPPGRAELAPDGVLFRIGPKSHLPPAFLMPRGSMPAPGTTSANAGDALLTEAEEAWVRGGGRMVLGVKGDYANLRLRTSDGAGDPEVAFPLWPPPIRLEPPTWRVLDGAGLEATHAVLARVDGPVLSRARIGEGEVFILSVPEILQNGRLQDGDHLRLLLDLAGTGRPVIFDEFIHGLQTQTGALELLRRWGFGAFMLLVGVASLVTLWRRRARVGPPTDDHEEARVEAVDLVDSLAQLYQRSLNRGQAAALYYQALADVTAIRTGLRKEALEARLRQEVGPRPRPRPGRLNDISDTEFEEILQTLNGAFGRIDDAQRSRGR